MWLQFSAAGMPAPWGLVAALGLLAAWLMARPRAARAGIPASHVDLLIPLAVGTGLVVAALTPALAGATGHPPGLPAAHGRGLFLLLGVALGVVLVYAVVARLPTARLLDALALPALLWLALLRVGCFLAGCCWGKVITAPSTAGGSLLHPFAQLAAVQYPAGSFAFLQQRALGLLGPGTTASLPVYPVQLFESAAAIGLLLIGLWREGRRPPRVPGWILALGGYAIARFLLEFLRADQPAVASGLSANQLACALIVAGCAGAFTVHSHSEEARESPAAR